MILSNCAICDSKKSRFTKHQDAKGLLSTNIEWYFILNVHKMNQIVNKLLLAFLKFMPEMHLKQPGFTYSACEPFTKDKERIQKFKETGDTSYIYKNKLDKACLQHDMAYGDFKN